MTTASKAEKYAIDLGAKHGKDAAFWWQQENLGGRVNKGIRCTARITLRGIEDGDPEVYYTLPSPDLSGQWAFELSGTQLYLDAYGGSPSEDWDDFNEVCDAYEASYMEAMESEVTKACEAVLEVKE